MAGGEGTAHRCGRPRLVGVENALDVIKSSLVLDVIHCGTRGARAVGAASACGNTLGAARRTPPPARVRRCGGAAGVGRGAAARTCEVQRGEGLVGLVGLERGGQLLGPLDADLIVCGTRGARAVGAVSACGNAPGAARSTHPPARVRACGGAAGEGRGAAARTTEVQRGEGLVGLERGGQLLGPLVADLIACGTRGARAVGAASACGNALGAARRTHTLHACACSAVPRG